MNTCSFHYRFVILHLSAITIERTMAMSLMFTVSLLACHQSNRLNFKIQRRKSRWYPWAIILWHSGPTNTQIKRATGDEPVHIRMCASVKPSSHRKVLPARYDDLAENKASRFARTLDTSEWAPFAFLLNANENDKDCWVSRTVWKNENESTIDFLFLYIHIYIFYSFCFEKRERRGARNCFLPLFLRQFTQSLEWRMSIANWTTHIRQWVSVVYIYIGIYINIVLFIYLFVFFRYLLCLNLWT